MIGGEIEDPSGEDRHDLPLTLIANRIRANVYEILGVEPHEDGKGVADVPHSVGIPGSVHAAQATICFLYAPGVTPSYFLNSAWK